MVPVSLHRKILVLNDGPSIHNLRSLLENLDREDALSGSGKVLMAMLDEKRFDAVVLDARGSNRRRGEEMRGIGEIRAGRVGKLLVVGVEVNGPKSLDLLERYILKGLPGALLWLISHRYEAPQPRRLS
ncbi:MAG TPA: hypothetical protein VFQ24_13020 [Terriglobia bacterium]|nr:hypothetical protein [Terriglobia bacterium]